MFLKCNECNEDQSWPPPLNITNVTLFFFKAFLMLEEDIIIANFPLMKMRPTQTACCVEVVITLSLQPL